MIKPIIAHRGRHIDYFENTLEAFKEAGKMSFYGIETDIHLTKDNVWVAHHDAGFYSNGKWYEIKDLSINELMALPLDNDQNHKEAKCCLLDNYLKICKESGKRPIIEIKIKINKKQAESLVHQIEQTIPISDITIISFQPKSIRSIQCLHKSIDIQLLVDKYAKILIGFAIFYRMGLDIIHTKLTEKIVRKFHKKKLNVNVFTVDEEIDFKKMLALDVDFITTNRFHNDSEINQ